MILRGSILLLFLLGLAHTKLLSFSQAVFEQIFVKHQIMLIYVGTSMSPQTQKIMTQACQELTRCAALEKSSPFYSQVVEFVGQNQEQYLAIIDIQERYKYVLSIDEANFSTQIVEDFVQGYENGTVDPFFASEPIPVDQEDSDCTRLVGANYHIFLAKDEPVKIVYLYSSDPICQNCPSLLRKFTKIARKHKEEGTMVFGYFDVSKNDNLFIRDEVFPNFLIYVLDNFQDPYGVDPEDFKELDHYIAQLKKDLKVSQNEEEENQAEQEKQLEQL